MEKSQEILVRCQSKLLRWKGVYKTCDVHKQCYLPSVEKDFRNYHTYLVQRGVHK